MEYLSFETQKDGNVISESGGADTVLSYLNFQTPRAIDNPLQTNTDSSASRKTVNSIAHPLLCLESISRSALCPEHHHKVIVCHFAQFLRTVQTVLRIGKITLAPSCYLKKERTQQKNCIGKVSENYTDLQKVRELCVQWYEQKIRSDAQI